MSSETPKLMTFDTIDIQYQEFSLKYKLTNSLVEWRVETLFTKEPETIEWVDTFEKDSVFYDVGANIGLYSIFAAITRDVNVFAFEPEGNNYSEINRNIVANQIDDKIKAYCCAVMDRNQFSNLNIMTEPTTGQSGNSFGMSQTGWLKPCKPEFKQGSISYSLDELIFGAGLPRPKYIKIDVDGFEHLIIKGADKTLELDTLDSVLIEINQGLKEHMGIINTMKDKGFKYDQEQVDKSKETNEGAFKDFANYIFVRD